jgi:5-methylcytosine-specific restriction protein A
MERTRGRRWMAMRQAVLTAEPLCRECLKHDRTTLAQEVDHITPLHKGGTDARDNLQPLCRACHAGKTASEHPQAKPIIRASDW